MENKYTAVVLAVLVVAAQAHVDKSSAPLALDSAAKSDGFGLKANVNEYVDQTLHRLAPVIQQNGLDPMELPEVVEGFSVKWLLLTYSAWLKINDGYMTGLSNVQRSGDQEVRYFAKMLRVRVSLQFNDLEFVYKYLVEVMSIGPSGGIRASLKRFRVVVDLLIDFNNDEIHIQEFSLNDIGRLRVRLSGNLFDWLLNPVIRVFTLIFDNTIIKAVESNIRREVQRSLDNINNNVKDIVASLESYNY